MTDIIDEINSMSLFSQEEKDIQISSGGVNLKVISSFH